jgi:AbrB family looped-hinge helix DNA binding protein
VTQPVQGRGKGTFTLTMSTRGQFVLPKEVRDRLRLLPGCKVEGTIDDQGRLVLVPAMHEPEELLRDRPSVASPVSIREMDEAITRALRRCHRV